MNKFNAERRQPFLPEEYYLRVLEARIGRFPRLEVDLERGYMEARGQRIELDAEGRLATYRMLAGSAVNLLTLRYTAGTSIAAMGEHLESIISYCERLARALRQEAGREDVAPFNFSDRFQYNQVMQILGLFALFDRADLMARFAALCDPVFKNADAIYDELLAPFLPERPSPEALFHDEPYDIVVDVIDAPDAVERASLMKEAVELWYPANEGQPFHDSHLETDPEGATAYYGYWCFELAALTVLLDIDDSGFRDHVTYPKDLADWARDC